MATWVVLCFGVRIYMRATVSGPFGIDDMIFTAATVCRAMFFSCRPFSSFFFFCLSQRMHPKWEERGKLTADNVVSKKIALRYLSRHRILYRNHLLWYGQIVGSVDGLTDHTRTEGEKRERERERQSLSQPARSNHNHNRLGEH